MDEDDDIQIVGNRDDLNIAGNRDGIQIAGNRDDIRIVLNRKDTSRHLKAKKIAGNCNVFKLGKGGSYLSVKIFDALCLSWAPRGDDSILLSPKILFEGKPDVRGGVPVVFSCFAPHESDSLDIWMEGNVWKVKDGFKMNSDTITLILQENDKIRDTWNYKFKIELTIVLLNEAQLKLDVVIANTGREKFSYSSSLFSFFTVTDVIDDKMSGLNGCTYILREEYDKSIEQTREQFVENSMEIKLSELNHRIYKNIPSGQKIEKLPSKHSVKVETSNFPDLALYNPYAEAITRLDRPDDDDKTNTICVEIGTIAAKIDLEPNKSHTAHLILTVE